MELPADEVEALSGSFSAVVELPADEVERDMYAPTHVHVSKQCDYWAGTNDIYYRALWREPAKKIT